MKFPEGGTPNKKAYRKNTAPSAILIGVGAKRDKLIAKKNILHKQPNNISEVKAM